MKPGQMVFVGVVESVVDLRKIRGLSPATNQVFKLNDPRDNRCMVEAVVSNTCPLIGKSIREGQFRSRYDAVVIAAHRNGERLDQKIGDIVLKPGDTLLLETHRRFLRHYGNRRDFFLVSHVPDSTPLRHERAEASEPEDADAGQGEGERLPFHSENIIRYPAVRVGSGRR